MAAIFSEQNIAFNVTDHSINVSKDLFCDFKITKKLKMYRKKCTSIIKNVIALIETSKIIQIIQK